MSGNAPSGSPDIVASTIETPSPSKASQALAVFALSAAIVTGQDARAADIGNMNTAKIEACVAKTQDGLGNLKAMIEKKTGLGELAKAQKLQTQYDETIAEAAKSCQAQLVSDVNIAKSEANILAYADIRKASAELSSAVQARLRVVDNFSNGDVSETNANIALIERANIYLAKARTMLTDQESVATLKQLEQNVAILVWRTNAGSGKKTTIAISSL